MYEPLPLVKPEQTPNIAKDVEIVMLQPQQQKNSNLTHELLNSLIKTLNSDDDDQTSKLAGRSRKIKRKVLSFELRE
jgi:hypothetical protein